MFLEVSPKRLLLILYLNTKVSLTQSKMVSSNAVNSKICIMIENPPNQLHCRLKQVQVL